MRHFDDHSDNLASQINLTPLIDMVFILLIFFIVTAKFSTESGVEVARPQAQSATPQQLTTIVITVTKEKEIWLENKEIDVRSLRSHIERLHAENPAGSVIIRADKSAPTGLTIQVLDQARLAGVSHVSVAASPSTDDAWGEAS